MRQVHRVQGLGERADLVDLDQQRVGGTAGDAAGQPLRVGDEQVVADDLDDLVELGGQRDPAVPVLLRHRVLDRDDRVVGDQVGVVGHHLLGRLRRCPRTGRRRRSRTRSPPRPSRTRCRCPAVRPALLDRLGDHVQRGAVGLQAGREAALVAEAGGQALGLQHRLQRVVDLGPLPQRLGEGGRPDRRDHELLDVDVGVGVRATVEDVEHRHRQQVGVRAAEVAEQRQAGRRRRRPWRPPARRPAPRWRRTWTCREYRPGRSGRRPPAAARWPRSRAAPGRCRPAPRRPPCAPPCRRSGSRRRAAPPPRRRRWTHRRAPPPGPGCRRRGPPRPRRSGCRANPGFPGRLPPRCWPQLSVLSTCFGAGSAPACRRGPGRGLRSRPGVRQPIRRP